MDRCVRGPEGVKIINANSGWSVEGLEAARVHLVVPNVDAERQGMQGQEGQVLHSAHGLKGTS